MKTIFLDIESIPPDESTWSSPDGTPADPDSEEFRKLALSGDYGRVLCIGVVIEQDGRLLHRGVLGRDRRSLLFHCDERRMLRAFWKLTADFDCRRDLFVGFNVIDFDLPFLLKRSIINRVRPTVEPCFARYRSAPIFDVMWEWNRWNTRTRISLDRLAHVLGLRSSKVDGITGAEVYDHYRAGNHEKIAAYCLRDVELTREMYLRLKFPDREVPALPEGPGAPVGAEKGFLSAFSGTQKPAH